jgi:ElaB/YqjD/DUF883 family membrane-anchored ribosome-binding protein
MDRIATDKLVQDMQAVVVDAREQLAAAGDQVHAKVKENPWAAAGIAAGVGLLLGLLIGRRD